MLTETQGASSRSGARLRSSARSSRATDRQSRRTPLRSPILRGSAGTLTLVQEESDEVRPRRSRPVEITAVAALAVVQGLLLLLVGGLLIAAGNDREVAASLEVDPNAVVVVGIVLVVLGLVQCGLAIALTRGRELVRSVFAVLATLQIAPAVYALVALQDVRAGSVLPLAISLGVLWLLYGSPRSQEFFAS